jgi:hypothetical protein
MPYGYKTLSTFNPQQQGLFNQEASGLSSLQPQIMQYLQQLLSGSPESTAAFEAPYMRQFHEQTIPHLAEQFAGLGATSSSGFQQALGQAGAGLSEQLAQLREGLRFGAAQQGQQGIQNLLGLNTQALVPKQPGFLKQLLLGLSGGFGQGVGSLPALFGR